MDTSLLHEKIERFAEQRKDKFSQEVASDVLGWLKAIERYISDIEMEAHESAFKLNEKDEMIELLVKILIILGRVDILLTMRVTEKESFNRTIDHLLKTKTRNANIHAVNLIMDERNI